MANPDQTAAGSRSPFKLTELTQYSPDSSTFSPYPQQSTGYDTGGLIDSGYDVGGYSNFVDSSQSSCSTQQMFTANTYDNYAPDFTETIEDPLAAVPSPSSSATFPSRSKFAYANQILKELCENTQTQAQQLSHEINELEQQIIKIFGQAAEQESPDLRDQMFEQVRQMQHKKSFLEGRLFQSEQQQVALTNAQITQEGVKERRRAQNRESQKTSYYKDKERNMETKPKKRTD